MKDVLINIWKSLVNVYVIYSNFIHSILPAELGDLAEAVLDIAVACLIIKLIADVAFKTKTEEF